MNTKPNSLAKAKKLTPEFGPKGGVQRNIVKPPALSPEIKSDVPQLRPSPRGNAYWNSIREEVDKGVLKEQSRSFRRSAKNKTRERER